MSTSQTASLAYPEIAKSDLEAVRRFLTAGRDEPSFARPSNVQTHRKAPAVSNGIARARGRSVSKAG